MGRPVITTDWIGCRHTVNDGVNGFLVPTRDPPALASAMARFVEDPGLIERMGVESRRLAEERFDVRKINARLMEHLGIGEVRPESLGPEAESGRRELTSAEARSSGSDQDVRRRGRQGS